MTTILFSRHSSFLMFCLKSLQTWPAKSSVLVGTFQRLPLDLVSFLFAWPLHTICLKQLQFASYWEYLNPECCQESRTTCHVGIVEANSPSVCPSTLSQLHWRVPLVVF